MPSGQPHLKQGSICIETPDSECLSRPSVAHPSSTEASSLPVGAERLKAPRVTREPLTLILKHSERPAVRVCY